MSFSSPWLPLWLDAGKRRMSDEYYHSFSPLPLVLPTNEQHLRPGPLLDRDSPQEALNRIYHARVKKGCEVIMSMIAEQYSEISEQGLRSNGNVNGCKEDLNVMKE